MTPDRDRSDLDDPLHVLLIEDNPGDARLFEEHLRDSGVTYNLRWEEDLETGLQVLDEASPDVLVLDLGLPDSEGPETVEVVAASVSTIPIVVLTGQGTLEMALDAQEAGATEYLQKEELTPALVGRTLRWAVREGRMQAQLHQRDAWLRSLTEEVSAGMFRAGPTGRIEHANEALLKMLGFEREEELIGRDLTTLSADPTQQGRMLAEEGADGMEMTLRRKDGAVLVGLLSAKAVYDADGEVLHYDGVIIDISEREERERRLRMLSEALEQAHEAVLITEAAPLDDPGPRIAYANSAFEEMTGYTEEEILGRTPRILQGPETSRAVLDSLREALEAGEPWQGETTNYRKDETPFLLQWNIAPVRDDSGDIEYWVSVQRDVTAEREREETLRRRKHLLEQTQRLAGAWEVDLHTEEVLWSEKLYEIHEVPTGTEIDLDTAIDYFAPEARPAIRDAFQRCVAEEEPYDLELPLVTAAGARRWVRTVGAPAEIRNGEVVKVAGAFQDITDRKREEHRRQQVICRVTDAIVEVDADWRFTLVNDQAEALYDMAEADLLGENFWEVFETGLDTAFEDTYRRVMDTREPDSIVGYFPRLDGWFDVEVYPNKDGGLAFYFDEITEQKQREETLRDREQKTAALYTATQQLVSAHTRQDVATQIQTLVSETFEYPLNSVHFVKDGCLAPAAVAPNVSDRVPEVPAPDLDAANLGARAYRSGETVVVEDFSKIESEVDPGELRSGACIPLGDHGVLLVGRTQTGGPDDFDVRLLELLGTYAATVLDRIKREETLREERDLLDRILETSPVAIAVFNPEGDFIQASGRAEEVLGLDKDAVTDRTYNDPAWDITTPEGEPLPDEELPFARVMATGEPVRDVEHTIKWPDGRRRLLSVSGAPLHNPDGELEGAVFHIDDITERRKAERQLRESERRFRKLFTEAPIGIARVDLDGRIIETNAAFRETLGYDAEKLRGRHFKRFTYEEDKALSEDTLENLVAGEGSSYTIEKRYRRADGTVFWARLTTSFLEHEGETQIISMVQDIDDQKRYQEHLRAAKEEAERMNRLKSAFLANMSHEIRTPLTSIIGFAEMIGEQVSDDVEGTIPQYAGLIEKSGHRLLQTLNSVLSFSKLESGEMDLSPSTIDLDVEARTAAQQFEPQAREAGIDLQMEIGEGTVWCRADTEGLRVVLRNLLSNAIKYTEHGGTAWVRTRTDDDWAILEVEDTGIGMDPETTDELFEAFTQESEGLAREYEGTGLGLAVCRRAVEEMGGSIAVETQKGEGSRFTVRLPRAEDPS